VIFPLRLKLALLMSALLLASIATVSWLLDQQYTEALETEARKRGSYIAESLARNARDPVLLEDDVVIGKLLESVTGEAEVVAARLVDGSGVLIDAKPPLENPEVSRMTRDAELAFATRGGELIVASRMVFSDVDLGEAQVVLDLHAIVGVVVERARFFLYLASGALLAGSILIAFSTSGRITRPLRRLRLAVNALAQGDTSARVDVSTRDEVADLTRAFNDMSASLSEKSRVETAFRRYVSDHVLQQVLDEPEAVQLLGERREITVLFIDIRRFTQLASRIEPERLVSYLNEAFELITDRLLEHGATVDKYIGDAILAYFGAPIEIEDHPARAVAAAISVQRSIEEFNQVRQSWRPPPERLDVGIGIQTGEVVVGNIGGDQ
jgi:class 3 adenylate cyclase